MDKRIEEDSSIFNFLDDFSPIKPIKSQSQIIDLINEAINVDVALILDEEKKNLDPRHFAEILSGDNDNQNCSSSPISYAYFSSEQIEGFGHNKLEAASTFEWERLINLDDYSPDKRAMENEEIDINPTNPRNKKRTSEQGEFCKRCNCKKSKCLKLYCECFAAGVYCVEPCGCVECLNKPAHEDTLLATRKQIESRNPTRRKSGCNCVRSGCLKKYCECYQGGVGCSINCRCEGCKNLFGRKHGSVGTNHELDENETNMSSSNSKRVLPRKLLF